MIPHVFHQFWLKGSPEMPARIVKCMESVKKLNPDFQFFLHTDPEELLSNPLIEKEPDIRGFYNQLGGCYRPLAVQCDLLKFIAAYIYGGYSLDIDMYAIRPMGNEFDEDRLVVGNVLDNPDFCSEAIFGTEQYSSIAHYVIRTFMIRQMNKIGVISANLASMTRTLRLKRYRREYFCPWWKGEPSDERYRVGEHTRFIHLWSEFEYDFKKLAAIQRKANHDSKRT